MLLIGLQKQFVPTAFLSKDKGKTYSAKTNAKGVAQVTIKKTVIDKLKAGKKYTVAVTYIKDTIKKTVTVKN